MRELTDAYFSGAAAGARELYGKILDLTDSDGEFVIRPEHRELLAKIQTDYLIRDLPDREFRARLLIPGA